MLSAHSIHMIAIASASVVSTAPPTAFFERWADMATWPAWNADTEWVRLDGPFVQGATGRLKPKGGPKVRFVVERLVPFSVFDDVSLLLGARLAFSHRVDALPDGGSRVAVTVTMTGPLGRLWHLILGKGIASTVQRDLEALARVAQGTVAA
jgi:hypothetical protein